MKRRVVVIYRELASYMVSCLRSLAAECNDDVLVLALPVNPEAPFKFENAQGLKIVDRSNFDHKKLTEVILKYKPELVLVADWTNSQVLRSCLKIRKKTTLVMGFDNHWRASLKQLLLTGLSRIVFNKVFKGVFVPGNPQKLFAQKLGFSEKKIKTGAYSANVELFSSIYRKHSVIKSLKYPKRFVCIARYVPQKGLHYLWEAYIELQKKHHTDWELWCLGTGEQFEQRVEYPGIKHLGFVQPEALDNVLSDCGVFVLPSLFEPWGVVVHEMAAAGFPMILTTKVGASEHFLTDQKNGYLVQPRDKKGLMDTMLKITKKSDHELREMGEQSHLLALNNTTELWAKKLLSFAP